MHAHTPATESAKPKTLEGIRMCKSRQIDWDRLWKSVPNKRPQHNDDWYLKEKMTGICPVCKGTLRVPGTPGKTYKYLAGYDEATHTLSCVNCGGQYMNGTPTGRVKLRPDGTPCAHEYLHQRVGECHHKYTCKHCTDSYYIDTSD